MVKIDSVEKFYRKCVLTDPSDCTAKIVLYRQDVEELIGQLKQWLIDDKKWKEEILSAINIGKNPSSSGAATLEKYKTQLQLKKVSLPIGFIEIGRNTTKRHGSEQVTYVYGKNARGIYGYKVFNGKELKFKTVGRIDDPTSQIGSFLRAIPMHQKFSVTDFMKLKGAGNGRRARALVDILKIEEYLQRTPRPLENRIGIVYGYLRTQKRDGLEVESNGQPAVSSNPPELKIELLKPFRA